MNTKQALYDMAMDSGCTAAGWVEKDQLIVRQEVRDICAGNGCGKYGTTWSCPPGLGTLEECRAKLMRYENFLLFSRKSDLEDSFDYEGMMEGHRAFAETAERFHEKLRKTGLDYCLLSNEGCTRCKKCTYPDAPCRFPEDQHGSLEGYGLIVADLAAAAGMKYINGKDTVTFFGMLMYNE
ncbi:MAG: DUF2284 domain-containing protein [Clostridia bacterium]|nr:DUF2284 domain-containing protein [Clostridia bacterium]